MRWAAKALSKTVDDNSPSNKYAMVIQVACVRAMHSPGGNASRGGEAEKIAGW
jgi:hypothetical protein